MKTTQIMLARNNILPHGNAETCRSTGCIFIVAGFRPLYQRLTLALQSCYMKQM